MIQKPVFLILFAFILPLCMTAQNKVGYVNTPKLLEAMPEVKAANARLDSLNKSYQDQLKTLYEEYQKLGSEAGSHPSDIMRKRVEEAGSRLQAYEDNARQDMAQKKEEYLNPILKKLSDLIKKVAAENHYDLILDSGQTGIVLFNTDKDDITDLVKKKLEK